MDSAGIASMASMASPDKWSADGGLPGLVIWALFLMIAVMMWLLEKKLTRVADETANLMMAIEKARSSIIEKLYEAGVLTDRRDRNYGRNLSNNEDRRKDGGD